MKLLYIVHEQHLYNNTIRLVVYYEDVDDDEEGEEEEEEEVLTHSARRASPAFQVTACMIVFPATVPCRKREASERPLFVERA